MKKIAFLPLLALLCGTLATAPAQAQPYRPAFTKYTLANGLDVILHRDTTLPYVSVNVSFHAGSARDPKDRFGLCSVAGTLFMAETRGFSAAKLQRIRESYGAWTGLNTNIDWTNYYEIFPAERLDTALLIEADRIRTRGALITDTMLTQLKQRAVTVLAKTLQAPYGDLENALFRELYPAMHPYRHTSAGDTTDIAKITLDDVRAFIAQYFTATNASLTIGGNFDPATVRTLVKKAFGTLPAATRMMWAPARPLPPLGLISLVTEVPRYEGRIYIAFRTVGLRDPDQPLLALAAKVLAGSDAGLLQRDLMPLNPGVKSVEAVQNSQELDGTFILTLNVGGDTEQQDVYEEVLRILSGITERGIRESDLATAKNIMEMEFLTPLEQFYGTGGRCDVLNIGNLYTGNPAFSFDQMTAAANATPEAVTAAVKRHLDPANHLVMSVVSKGLRRLAVKLK